MSQITRKEWILAAVLDVTTITIVSGVGLYLASRCRCGEEHEPTPAAAPELLPAPAEDHELESPGPRDPLFDPAPAPAIPPLELPAEPQPLNPQQHV